MMLQVLAIIGYLAGLPAAFGTPLPGTDDAGKHHATSEFGANDSVSADAGRLSGPWPGFRQNAAHTARSNNSGPLHPWKAWNYDMGGSTYSSPAVGEDGSIYVGSADSIYALTPGGRRRWATAIGGYAISSPAIGDEGTVFVGSRDGKLYALQSANGLPLWTPFQAGDEIWSSPTIAADGTVYVGSFDGNLYAIDPASGEARWAFSTGSEIVSSPAIGRDGTVYVAALDRQLYAVNPNGSERWSFATDGDIASSPAVAADGTIYVGSFDGELYAVRPDGSARWTTPFRTDDRIISSPAIAANGTIYVGSLDGNLYAVRPDGTQEWSFDVDSEIFSSPAVDAQGIIYFGSYGGWLYAVRPDGTAHWSLDLGDQIWSSPAIGNGRTLYIASTDGEPFTGHLHAIRSVAFEVAFRTVPVDAQPQVVDVSAPTDFAPNSGRLFYRRGGERTYRGPVTLVLAGGRLEGTIPAEDVTLRGIEYYVELTDGSSIATYPPDDPMNRPAVRTVRLGQSMTADIDLPPSRYAMVSVPLSLDNPTLQSVLEDDYGPYAPFHWRVLRWERGEYQEHDAAAATFKPGTAFFLNVRDGDVFDVEDGESVDTSVPYPITLQPGWNQVANPFAFPVALEDIERDLAEVTTIAYWDGEEMCQEASCIDVWQPWEGYFVFNRSDDPAKMFVEPVEAAGIEGVPEESGEAEATDESADRREAVEGHLLRLVASVPGTLLKDTQNWIGFDHPRQAGNAPDMLEAPPIGRHVRLSVMDGDARYARRLQPLSAEGAQWELELAVGGEDPQVVHVSLVDDANGLPDGFHASILDRDFNEVIPMNDSRFAVRMDRKHAIRRLSLVIGTESFREDALGAAPLQSPTFALEQNYPNPFNPETMIGYHLAQSSHVVLEVYDVTGRRVRTLVNGFMDAGYHEAAWDGVGDRGDHVASGVYLYRIRSGTSILTKKMLLLR